VTPSTRTPTAAHSLLLAPEYGGGEKPHDYGTGRVCANGCGTVLRRTNPDAICDPCQRAATRRRLERERSEAVNQSGRALRTADCEVCGDGFTTTNRRARYCSSACRHRAFKARHSGEAASAGAACVTGAASPPHATEEGKMPQRPDSVSGARVLDLLVTGEVVSGQAIAEALGCTRSVVGRHVKNLRKLGWHITSVPKRGHRLDDVKPWDRKTGDLVLGVYKDAPAAPPAQAPDPTPEPPATPAALDSSTPAPPTAGTCSSGPAITVDWFTTRTGRARLSPVGILAAIEDLTEEERERTLECVRVLYGCCDVKGAGQ